MKKKLRLFSTRHLAVNRRALDAYKLGMIEELAGLKAGITVKMK